MKKFLSFVFLLFSFSQILACSCERSNFAKEYQDATVVAIVTVAKTYGDYVDKSREINLNFHKAELKFDKIYKGEKFKELIVLGSSMYANSASCEKHLTVGEQYLIMLTKNTDGSYYINACSAVYDISFNKIEAKKRIQFLDYVFYNFEKYEKELSEFKFAHFINNSQQNNKSGFTKQDLKNLKNKIAVYKVTIDNDHKITTISAIIKPGYKNDKIEKIIKNDFYIDDRLINYKIKTYLIFIDFDLYFLF